MAKDHIVGMMWNKNEGDILEEIISEAVLNVDTLFIADDGSTDDSWDIIQRMKQAHKQIEHIQREPNKKDKAQRQSLLSKIQKRYRPEDTLVQIIESDIMLLETDIRKAFKERSNGDVALIWVALNAIRKGRGGWEGFDTYPNWYGKSIKEVMPKAHYMEEMTYTFRPFKELNYTSAMSWRPWPQGFSKFSMKSGKDNSEYTPLLAHYGYRGPTHVHLKYSPKNRFHSRYKSWDFSTPQTVADTVYFFNGQWNSKGFPMTREGWKLRKTKYRYEIV